VSRPSRRHPTEKSAPRRSARATRAWAVLYLLCAALLFLTHAARLSHLFLTPHTLCEHGELLDLDTQRAAQGKAHPRAEKADDERSLDRDTPATQDEHEHCDATAIHHIERRFELRIGQATLLCIDPPRSVLPGSGERPIHTLHLAPKNSPPRVGVSRIVRA